MKFEIFASFCMILAALAASIEAQHNGTEIAPTAAANSINGTIEFGEFLTSSSFALKAMLCAFLCTYLKAP